jgi:NTE family protein
MVGQIVALAESAPPAPAKGPSRPLPMVREIRIEGVPASMVPEIARRFEPMVGRPLDLAAANGATTRLSRREDIASASASPVRLDGEDGVALVVSVVRRPAYEIGLNGYVTNLHSRRWVSLDGVARDLWAAGDSLEGELRLGDQWGFHARYFTPEKNDGQWGFALIAREEEITPLYGIDENWNRYALRGAYYINNGNTRIGLGLIGERVNSSGENTDSFGPYLYMAFNGLDNTLFPTRGYAITADGWMPDPDVILARIEWQAYMPWRDDWRVVFKGGFENGDAEIPAHRAYLGDQEELFSLAEHPLQGDRDLWVHLGVGHTLMKTWWGGLNAELFGTWGTTYEDWDQGDEFWEAGVGLYIPGTFLNGRILMVYDQEGDVTFGFSLGTPSWDPNPLP